MSTSNEPIYGNPQKPYGFELVADTLVKEGIECVFTLTGNSVISLIAALGQKGIKVVSCRSEQGAVLAATGYALNSGKVGVAICTAGYMGLAHYGMLNATWGHVPIVMITGANETFTDELRSQQELDQKPIAKSANVKAAYHVIRGERIPQMLSWAFNIAQSGVPGLAYIDIAQDVLKGQVDASEISRFVPCNINAKTMGDPELVKKAVELLASAKTPAIIIGRLGAAADIRDELKEFVELTGIPVDNCMGTLGTHPLNIGTPYDDADVVLMVGKQSIGIKPQSNACNYTGKIISVYPETQDFGHSYPVEMGIAGDVKLVMRQLVEEAKKVKFPDYSELVAERIEMRNGIKEIFAGVAEEYPDNTPIHPAVLAKETVEFMIEHEINEKAVLMLDGGDCLLWYSMMAVGYGVFQEYPGQVASIVSIENGTAIGMGLGMAVGAASAKPGEFLFVPALGDGAIGYNICEMETLARENVPGVIVVANNSCWGMVYNDQRRIYGRNERSGGFLGQDVHYEKVAEGFGCIAGDFVTESANIRPALEKAYEIALRESKPVVVNVITDPFIYNIEFGNWTLPATEKGEPYNGIGEA